MNICIPVNEDLGLESPVCGHFGSAPLFMIVDTETSVCSTVVNSNQGHQHGMCQPLKSLAGLDFDALVVGGIGMGALSKLMAGNIKVFLAQQETVGLTVESYKTGQLKPVTPEGTCAGHGHGGGGGCGHH
jgi:predicted Fe-Mo cluster-binding NifX family protein